MPPIIAVSTGDGGHDDASLRLAKLRSWVYLSRPERGRRCLETWDAAAGLWRLQSSAKSEAKRRTSMPIEFQATCPICTERKTFASPDDYNCCRDSSPPLTVR